MKVIEEVREPTRFIPVSLVMETMEELVEIKEILGRSNIGKGMRVNHVWMDLGKIIYRYKISLAH